MTTSNTPARRPDFRSAAVMPPRDRVGGGPHRAALHDGDLGFAEHHAVVGRGVDEGEQLVERQAHATEGGVVHVHRMG